MRKTIKVASVCGDEELVLNIGEEDKVKIGDRYLVYGEGGEIFDPDTKKPLGKLEIVKGTGRVVHVQPKMCTVRTDMEEHSKTKKKKRVLPSNSIMAVFPGLNECIEEEEYIEPPRVKPFRQVEVGDFAKYIT